MPEALHPSIPACPISEMSGLKCCAESTWSTVVPFGDGGVDGLVESFFSQSVFIETLLIRSLTLAEDVLLFGVDGQAGISSSSSSVDDLLLDSAAAADIVGKRSAAGCCWPFFLTITGLPSSSIVTGSYWWILKLAFLFGRGGGLLKSTWFKTSKSTFLGLALVDVDDDGMIDFRWRTGSKACKTLCRGLIDLKLLSPSVLSGMWKLDDEDSLLLLVSLALETVIDASSGGKTICELRKTTLS